MTRNAERNPAGIPSANEQKTTAIRRIGEGEGTGKTNREHNSIAAIVSALTNRLAAMLEIALAALVIRITSGGERPSTANNPQPG